MCFISKSMKVEHQVMKKENDNDINEVVFSLIHYFEMDSS